VTGVGEKTASAMLTQYGSLENILSAAHNPKSLLPKAFRAKILAATDYIAAARPVVRVARDAPVQLFTADGRLPAHAADPDRVAELSRDWGIASSIGRIQKALDSITR
jgi:5'-3' exonuclease